MKPKAIESDSMNVSRDTPFQETDIFKRMNAIRPQMDEAIERANRNALLEHARMGRPVPIGAGDGQVVWLTPVEIFAHYGLDEFGRSRPNS